MDRQFGRRSFAPVQVGDVIALKIEAVGEKGDGIAKIEGFVIFVPNTKEGDEVKVKITKVLQKVGFGEVVGEGEAASSDDQAEEAPAEDADQKEEAPQETEEEPKDSEDF